MSKVMKVMEGYDLTKEDTRESIIEFDQFEKTERFCYFYFIKGLYLQVLD